MRHKKSYLWLPSGPDRAGATLSVSLPIRKKKQKRKPNFVWLVGRLTRASLADRCWRQSYLVIYRLVVIVLFSAH